MKPFDHTWEEMTPEEDLCADLALDIPPAREPWTITVKQIVADEDLDHDDREENPEGEYTVNAYHEEEALDFFHSSVPIANLGHFAIEAHPWTEADGHDQSTITPDHLFTEALWALAPKEEP
jgi:hypothetical protein